MEREGTCEGQPVECDITYTGGEDEDLAFSLHLYP